ncbi:uncharacterized protein Z518_04182 [Rhinocladiella mackenziei CBS 650.93]|uniref:Rhinocladiella mackenziei CBS 650.93 unplaced genomic scaffold supercont1.3, whole genome shotgun sequence n=1 Tax=Rhinocladiella mackenziei CBS 650.93 TaxID=1442369 RepID=A0A0D2FVK7_9EURO|nr:uncharacterized protein Z518_04182 [Rhinocladiella mackenziei CBS 650.93]KIX06207.1 hypothetical protein Z518_04182 [Rhinocladiella mackenziei CBS 650.93]
MAPHPNWSPSTLPSLNGRTYLVTGGNTGIGYWTVHHLALHGATVYATSRSEDRGSSAISSIKASIMNSNKSLTPTIHLVVVDLMSLTSVVAGADRIRRECSQLHGIVNSAGIMATPFLMSEDGYESQFQTNYLAHWLLTAQLLPLLESTARFSPAGTVRVVNVSSTGHTAALKEGISFADTSLKENFTFRRYAQSKLANILHANALHTRYRSAARTDKSQIWALSLHPGAVDTQLNTNTWGSSVTPILRCLGMYITPEQGSFNSLWAVAAPDVTAEMSGQYFMPVGVKKAPSKPAQDAELAEKLWDWTEKEMRAKGFLNGI